jgi:cytochrome b
METVPWTDPVVLRMAAVVAWLVIAARVAAAARSRPDGGRTTARLALVSLAVLAASIAWGVLGTTRHGKPVTAAVVAVPTASEESP